jgi:hypothetical protein
VKSTIVIGIATVRSPAGRLNPVAATRINDLPASIKRQIGIQANRGHGMAEALCFAGWQGPMATAAMSSSTQTKEIEIFFGGFA